MNIFNNHGIVSSLTGKNIQVGSALKKEYPHRQKALESIRKWIDDKKKE